MLTPMQAEAFATEIDALTAALIPAHQISLDEDGETLVIAGCIRLQTDAIEGDVTYSAWDADGVFVRDDYDLEGVAGVVASVYRRATGWADAKAACAALDAWNVRAAAILGNCA